MKKNKLRLTNNLFQNLLNIQALGFEDKYDENLLSIDQINSYLIRDKGEILDKIFYDYHISRDKSCKMGGITFSIILKQVNAILNTILSKPQLIYIDRIIREPYEDTIIDRITIDKGHDLVREICSVKFIENEILSKEKLGQVADLCKVYINDYMQPFFNSINTIQDINEKIINGFPEDKWGDFFRGETRFKVTVIMKLCNNSKYEAFSQTSKKMMCNLAYNKGLAEYRDYHTLYCTLLEYLDSEEYKQ
jgi:hypothetical protein